MLSHGKLDLSYFFGRAENCVDLLHISVAEIAEENNLPPCLLENIINSFNKLSLRLSHNNQLLFWTLCGGWTFDTFLIISSRPTGEIIGIISKIMTMKNFNEEGAKRFAQKR